MGAAALLLSACATPPGPGPTPGPTADTSLVGRVLTNDDPVGLMYQPLPDGEPRRMSLPEEADFAPFAVPAGDGAIALAYVEDRGRLYRLRPGEDPRRILPEVREPVALAATESGVVVGDCARKVLVLADLDGGGRREVGGGCLGAVSPDGTLAAYAAGGGVWRVPVDGSSAPVRLFALSDVPGLDDEVSARDRRVFEIVWGEPGLAISVGTTIGSIAGPTGDTGAVVVASVTGNLRVISTLGSTFVTFLRWQPDGRLLAVATGQTGGEGFLRVYDPDEDRLRTIGLHPRGFVSAAWAPDGESILAVSGASIFGSGLGYWLHLDLEGRQLGRTRGTGAVIYGWVP
jgi:hypothetical protein